MTDSTQSLRERLRQLFQSPSSSHEPFRQGLFLEGLEPRVLYSASPASPLPETIAEPSPEAVHVAADSPAAGQTAGGERSAVDDVIAKLDREALAGLAGDDVALSTFDIDDLEAPSVASLHGRLVTLDPSAQGHGWSTRADSSSRDAIDLRTALTHESDHLTGSNLEDSPLRRLLGSLTGRN